MAAVAYIPLLLTHRGQVGADTKTYLYLNSSRLLGRATSMWDPSTGMGGVTHENIGYLWPMGPWYRVWAALHVPTWVAQRLWLGTLLLLAGLGVRWLVRTLGWSGPGLAVASVAYMLSPYVLQYEARISAVLMAWTALPWMLGLTIRALRTGSWRHPALFALAAATAGSVNATCMIFAGLASVLWLPFAVWGLGEGTWRQALVAFAKMLGLSLVVALWWLVGLLLEGGYGLNILRYTETVEVVARTGVPTEAIRGLGNWYFYGTDAVGPWVQPAVEYTHWGWLMAVSFILPVLAVVAAGLIRWRYKLYFAGLIVIGVALAVGVHPYSHPSPIGWVLKAFAKSSTLGLALRSTGRAVPLVALGTAILLGAGIDALWRRIDEAHVEEATRRRRVLQATAASGAVSALVLMNMAPLWMGQFVDNNLQAPDHLPSYWSQAAGYLDSQGQVPSGTAAGKVGAGSPTSSGYATRVLELPGADFSDYRWGVTLDPVTPGITDRPFVGRQLQPAGSAQSADLLRALDRRLQEGVLDPEALAPLARKMGVGDIVLRSDLQYERFRTPRPRSTWLQFNPAPVGLEAPIMFGPGVAEKPLVPFTDEITLGTPTGAPNPPAVAVFGVSDPQSIIRTERTAEPMILAGDGEGMVDVAAAGLLDPNQPVLYAAQLDSQPGTFSQALNNGADLVVTDTNKLRAQRWGTIRDVYGYTEQPGQKPLASDTADARLPVFPGAASGAYTVAEQRGGVDVVASGYGNSIAYAPGERPAQAMDGNAGTAWKVGAFANAVGNRLRITLKQPTRTGQVTLVQPPSPPKTPPPGAPPTSSVALEPGQRYITKVTLTFDGQHPVERMLDLSSLTSAGQTLNFPVQSFKRLDIRIDDTNLHHRDTRHDNGVGFAEVRIGTPQTAPKVDEVLRLPTDLLNKAGASSLQHKLDLVMTRDRANPAEPFITDPEAAMARTFNLPTGRSFAISGTARVSARAPDQVVDRWLGRPDPPLANSSGRLPGDLAARSSSALDGNPATAWSPGLGPQVGNWLSVNLPRPQPLSTWTMQVVADGRHSVPTRLRVTVDDRPDVLVNLPPIVDQKGENATVSVPISIPSVMARSRVTVTIDAVRTEQTLDSISQNRVDLPVAVAELGIPGVTVPPAGTSVPADCHTDLMTIDGKPVGLRILGATAGAGQRNGLAIQPCGPGVDREGALALGPGPHVVRTVPGQQTGIDLDRLMLTSDRGGAPLVVGGGAGAAAGGGSGSGSPAVTVLAQGRTSAKLQVLAPSSAPTTPFWLVLGQSHNKGWKAEITGKGGHSLGSPRLIDGYANGWLVTPTPGAPMAITLTWTPQGTETTALWLSALAAVMCLSLAVFSVRYFLRSTPAPRAGRLPERPAAYRPWKSFEPGLSWRRNLAVVLGCGLAAALIIGWLAGPVVAAIVALGLLGGKWRALPAAVAVLALALSGLYVIAVQLSHHDRLALEWPQHSDPVAGLAWVGIALLAADALLRHLQARRPRRQ